MPSHVYLAFGNMGDQRVMKVGKASDCSPGFNRELSRACTCTRQSACSPAWEEKEFLSSAR